MSTTTDHLHLVKPAKNETADSDVINANMVAIDNAIYGLGHKPTTDAGKFMMVDDNGEVKPTVVSTQGATTYNVSGSDRTIPAKTYLSGAQTIKAVTTQNIDASNIKSGVVVKVGDANNAGRIKNVTGTLNPHIERAYRTFDMVSTETKTVAQYDSFGARATIVAPSGFDLANCGIRYIKGEDNWVNFYYNVLLNYYANNTSDVTTSIVNGWPVTKTVYAGTKVGTVQIEFFKATY